MSTTNVWLIDKEEEISEAFSGGNCRRSASGAKQASSQKFIEKAKSEFAKKFPNRSI